MPDRFLSPRRRCSRGEGCRGQAGDGPACPVGLHLMFVNPNRLCATAIAFRRRLSLTRPDRSTRSFKRSEKESAVNNGTVVAIMRVINLKAAW